MQKMKVKKPWGAYEVLLDEPNYKVKRIVVHPYERFSLQYHKHREEHWVIVEGDGIVQVKHKEYPAIVRSHWVILPRELHRATAGPSCPLPVARTRLPRHRCHLEAALSAAAAQPAALS